MRCSRRRSVSESAYWRAARETPPHETLAQIKLDQFASRGVLAAFDLEPLNAEDWTILHFGMGRRPARYDRIADRVPAAESRVIPIDMLSRDIEKCRELQPLAQ